MFDILIYAVAAIAIAVSLYFFGVETTKKALCELNLDKVQDVIEGFDGDGSEDNEEEKEDDSTEDSTK